MLMLKLKVIVKLQYRNPFEDSHDEEIIHIERRPIKNAPMHCTSCDSLKKLLTESWKEVKVVFGKFYQTIAVAASGVLCKQVL